MLIKNIYRGCKVALLGISILCIQGCLGNLADDCSWLPAVFKSHVEDQNIDTNKYNVQHALQMYPNALPIVVIGSGPAGLGAGLYGARDNTRTVVIEGGNPGGLLMYTTEVENWPGEKSIQGPEIIKKMHEQVEAAGAEFIADAVEKVDFSVWPYEIRLMGGDVLHALTVIIATGASPKKLGVPGEEQYWGKGVTACAVCDARFFAGEDVVVVGGGDGAVEEALQLINHVRSVTILVRKGSMRAAASMQDRIKDNPAIKIVYNVEIQKIVGDEKQVTAIELINHKTGAVSTMATSGVFLAVGHTPNSALFKDYLKLNPAGYIITLGRTQLTAMPGIFAAGEVEDHRYRQAGVSFGDGTKAGLDALAFLRKIGFSKTLHHKQPVAREPEDEKEEVLAPALIENELSSIASQAQLQKLLAQEKPVVLDFYTDTCPSCLQMLPVVRSVAKDRNDILFFKVNADQAIDLVKKFYVYKVPCLLVFKNGGLVVRYNEPITNKEKLVQLLDKAISQTE